MVINIDSSEQSRARLQLQPTHRCVGSTSHDLWVGAPNSPTPQVQLLTKAYTAANHYGPKSTTHCSPKRSFSPFKHRVNATRWCVVSV